MFDIYELGENIKDLRKKNNLTQDDLAQKLFITRQALSKWENGDAYPSIEALYNMSMIFNVSIDEILSIKKPKDKIDVDSLFLKYSREYILRSILNKSINIDIPKELYRFSDTERLRLLKAIKEEMLECDLQELVVRLTPSELKYICTNYNIGEIEK